MTPHNIESYYELLVQIRDLLLKADERSERLEKEMRGINHETAELRKERSKWPDILKPEPVTTSEPAYDWWRLENGQYAKIERTVLRGQIYNKDGSIHGAAYWNPYSLECTELGYSELNLKNRKSSPEDKGWPEWTR